MRVALGQLQSGTDIADNLASIETAATSAARTGVELIVFPEYAMYEKAAVDHTFSHIAEPIDGKFGTAIAHLAKTLRIAIVVGVVELNPSDVARPFNTLALWNANGNLVITHRKVHLYDAHHVTESRHITPGDPAQRSVGALGDTIVGLQACYELRFPEVSAALSEAGATVLTVGASWVPGPQKTEQWTTLARARAIENQCHLLAVNQSAPISIGASVAVSPRGEVIAQLGTAPGWEVVDLRPQAVREARAADTHLLRLRAEARRRERPI